MIRIGGLIKTTCFGILNGTYGAAILRNAHNLAEEMGNSVQIVRAHYDAVVSPTVAHDWWRIRPKKCKK